MDQEQEMLNNRLQEDGDMERVLGLHAGFMSDLIKWSRNQDCEHDDPRELEVTGAAVVTCRACGHEVDQEKMEMVLGY